MDIAIFLKIYLVILLALLIALVILEYSIRKDEEDKND